MIRFSIRWLMSRKIRMAVQMRHQVWKYLNAQRDLLEPDTFQPVEGTLKQLTQAIHHGDRKQVEQAMSDTEEVANKHLKPYPRASIRENVEVCLVAAGVVLAFRTFFLQPMAIPSGSAQPTFWGIVAENLMEMPEAQVPNRAKRFFHYWVQGQKYYHIQAKDSGTFRVIDERPIKLFPLISKQRFRLGDTVHTVWLPPEDLWAHAQLRNGLTFSKGDNVIKLKVTRGDHLFVDRFTYNFRRPARGETIVFASTGVPGLTQNTHYIKRLIALGGEKVRIGDDRHVYINGEQLSASDPGFEFVYTFDRDGPPRKSHYSGHANDKVAQKYGFGRYQLASLFPDGETEYPVPENHYFTLGDNTMNSNDSRNWGAFPREKVIGKQFFVFWPITDRFGWHNR